VIGRQRLKLPFFEGLLVAAEAATHKDFTRRYGRMAFQGTVAVEEHDGMRHANHKSRITTHESRVARQ
jgi:hypothetical protein